MPSAKRNFLSLIVVVAVFGAIMLTGVIGNMRRGNYVVLPIMLTSLGICGLAIWFGHYRVRVLLRDRTPERIIDHYHRSVRRIPYADAAAAYLSALAAAFFGEFSRAHRELDAVDWDKMPPMYQGHRLYAQAVLALLEDTDYPKALRLADEGKRLESTDPKGGLELLDGIIHLVADGANPETIERLERVANKQHGMMPAMCAWALAIHYKRTNQTDKAADYKSLLRMMVPSCAPLQS